MAILYLGVGKIKPNNGSSAMSSDPVSFDILNVVNELKSDISTSERFVIYLKNRKDSRKKFEY